MRLRRQQAASLPLSSNLRRPRTLGQHTPSRRSETNHGEPGTCRTLNGDGAPLPKIQELLARTEHSDVRASGVKKLGPV